MIDIWMMRSDFGEIPGDNCDKFFVADSSIAVLVGIVDHLVDLSGGEPFSDGVADSLEVFRAEGVGALGVEDLIKLLEGLLGGGLTLTEDGEEGGEVEFLSIGVGLHDGDDVGSLALHVEGADGVQDFFHGDLAAVVVVEQIEDFLEFVDGLGVHALVGVFGSVETLSHVTSTLDMFKVSKDSNKLLIQPNKSHLKIPILFYTLQ